MKNEVDYKILCKVAEKYLNGFQYDNGVESPSVNRVYLNNKMVMVAYTMIGNRRILTVFKNFYDNLTNLFQTEMDECLIDWFNKTFHDNCEEIEIL